MTSNLCWPQQSINRSQLTWLISPGEPNEPLNSGGPLWQPEGTAVQQVPGNPQWTMGALQLPSSDRRRVLQSTRCRMIPSGQMDITRGATSVWWFASVFVALLQLFKTIRPRLIGSSVSLRWGGNQILSPTLGSVMGNYNLCVNKCHNINRLFAHLTWSGSAT